MTAFSRTYAHSAVWVLLVTTALRAQAPIRVDSAYEDSVRIVVLWNESSRTFDDFPSDYNVGHQTRDFVVAVLDTTRLHNVKVLPCPTSTWQDIRDLWPGESPHAIVHVNAGYFSLSGPYLQAILDSAVANSIGVVSIGDDAASFSTNTFGLNSVVNIPRPMGGAQNIDSLWIGLNRDEDERLKDFDIRPWVNGIISNAVDSLDAGTHLVFKPYCTQNSETCRNESDADQYAVLYPEWLTMLGYQRGYNYSFPSGGVHVADSNELNVIVAIQDTTYSDPANPAHFTVRRGVALSYQPQYLVNSEASQQIVYDAIMFSSLSHVLGRSSLPHDYTMLRIGVLVNDEFVEIDAVEMDADADTVLWAVGQRSDNSQWEYVEAVWSSDGIPLESASGSGTSWQVSPTGVGEGTVTAATENTADGSVLSASVSVAASGSTRAVSASGTKPAPVFLLVGSQRFAVPAGACRAHVDIFSPSGRHIDRYAVDLNGQDRGNHEGHALRGAGGCSIVVVRFRNARGSSDDAAVRLVAHPR